jgi:hypothetical protein
VPLIYSIFAHPNSTLPITNLGKLMNFCTYRLVMQQLNARPTSNRVVVAVSQRLYHKQGSGENSEILHHFLDLGWDSDAVTDKF